LHFSLYFSLYLYKQESVVTLTGTLSMWSLQTHGRV